MLVGLCLADDCRVTAYMRKSGRDRLIKMRTLRLLPLSAREGSALALQSSRVETSLK